MRLLLTLLVGAGFCLTGCATGSGGDSAQYNCITTEQTAFLQQGPGQTVPDKYLPAGTRVRIVMPSSDYTRIETVYGESGWVKTSVLDKHE